MSDQVHYNNNGTIAYMPTYQAVVTGLPVIGRPSAETKIPHADPTQPTIKRELSAGDEHLVYWGDGNDFPQQIVRRYQRNTVIPETLDKKAALWLGGGVIATVDEESDTMVDDPRIRAFLKDITTKRYLREMAKDFAWFVNGFPEFILSKDRKTIVQLHANETSYCRWGRMDETTGRMDRVYLNANWPSATATDTDTIMIPAINPYDWDRVAQVRAGSSWKYIYPLSYPSPNSSYYQLANHHSVISSSWLDVLEAIPQFKKFAMQNQMTLRYHIEVTIDYWSKIYGEKWDEGSFSERMSIRDEFLSNLMAKLTNIENAHSAVLTDKWIDHADREQGVVINVLKDTHVEGKYNEDYSEGNANLFYTLGWDPTLSGFASKEMGSRSGGSDKREALLIFINQAGPYRQSLLEPLDFVAEYNGWKKTYPELTFKIRDTLLTTLDTGKSTTTENTPA
ncbi:hypothetical protein F5984_20525 [Rudanella paleaurantiibacter]|uniref:Uncharacterized protein n=1 Tax=Rudanella paleaurantiibacter TaxID=2614655 RepID=A0A7J5TVF8_9BACT|nr:hypothetical protein [Rudanella paleaurantiibacter]KAB7728134.1 hypothetical protein F5984_20525 [Rudanella paleaurantiibacter]